MKECRLRKPFHSLYKRHRYYIMFSIDRNQNGVQRATSTRLCARMLVYVQPHNIYTIHHQYYWDIPNIYTQCTDTYVFVLYQCVQQLLLGELYINLVIHSGDNSEIWTTLTAPQVDQTKITFDSNGFCFCFASIQWTSLYQSRSSTANYLYMNVFGMCMIWIAILFQQTSRKQLNQLNEIRTINRML